MAKANSMLRLFPNLKVGVIIRALAVKGKVMAKANSMLRLFPNLKVGVVIRV